MERENVYLLVPTLNPHTSQTGPLQTWQPRTQLDLPKGGQRSHNFSYYLLPLRVYISSKSELGGKTGTQIWKAGIPSVFTAAPNTHL